MVLALISNPRKLHFSIFEDEDSEAEIPQEEEEIGVLEESTMSFWLSGPDERLSRNDQSNEELTSSGDSVMQSCDGSRGDRYCSR